jgi:hypothetical protein
MPSDNTVCVQLYFARGQWSLARLCATHSPTSLWCPSLPDGGHARRAPPSLPDGGHVPRAPPSLPDGGHARRAPQAPHLLLTRHCRGFRSETREVVPAPAGGSGWLASRCGPLEAPCPLSD